MKIQLDLSSELSLYLTKLQLDEAIGLQSYINENCYLICSYNSVEILFRCCLDTYGEYVGNFISIDKEKYKYMGYRIIFDNTLPLGQIEVI